MSCKRVCVCDPLQWILLALRVYVHVFVCVYVDGVIQVVRYGTPPSSSKSSHTHTPLTNHKKALQRRAHPRDPEPQGNPLPRRCRGRPRHRRPPDVRGADPRRAGLAAGHQVGGQNYLVMPVG